MAIGFKTKRSIHLNVAKVRVYVRSYLDWRMDIRMQECGHRNRGNEREARKIMIRGKETEKKEKKRGRKR